MLFCKESLIVFTMSVQAYSIVCACVRDFICTATRKLICSYVLYIYIYICTCISAFYLLLFARTCCYLINIYLYVCTFVQRIRNVIKQLWNASAAHTPITISVPYLPTYLPPTHLNPTLSLFRFRCCCRLLADLVWVGVS